jgi:hypothetical protein
VTLADDPIIGVAPGPAERDPDPPLLIIDLSGRKSRPADPQTADPEPADEITMRIPRPLADPVAERPDAPIGMPPSRTGRRMVKRDEEPPTQPIRGEPPTQPIEPLTVPIAGEPLTVPIEGEPLTVPIEGGELTTAPPKKPHRRVRARARVYPRRLRRTGTVAGHRRRRDRMSLRRWEAVAWIAAAGVIAAMAGFVIRSAPLVKPLNAPLAGASAGVAPAAVNCVLQACPRSYPPGPPTRVRIPAIHVDSSLESLSLNSAGVLNAPDRYDEAGWYAGGVVPGNNGPAVIAGHVDSTAGPAVFFSLRTLVPGELVSVERGGVWVDFRVTQVEEYPKDQFPTDQVYRPTPDPELRVITCGGDFDTVHKRYYDNVVVYAILA